MKTVKIIERPDALTHLAPAALRDLPDSVFHVVVSEIAYAAIQERRVLQSLIIGFQYMLNKYIEEMLPWYCSACGEEAQEPDLHFCEPEMAKG